MSVNRMMSHRPRVPRHKLTKHGRTSMEYVYTCRHNVLDKISCKSILVFTSCRPEVSGHDDAAAQTRDRQAGCSTARRHAQPSAAGCATSVVPGQRLFRSGRHGSGQVRDASAGPCRQPASFSSCARVWALPPLLLSGQFQLRQSRAGGIGAIEARSKGRPQTHAGSNGIYRGEPKSAAIAELRATGRACKERIRRSGSPAKHRTATAAGKKTPLKSVSTSYAASPNHGAYVAQYEELRCQALIRHRGPGLVVLIRHGVFAWMNACSACSASLPAEPDSLIEAEPVIPEGLHTEVVLILAGMLLHGYLEARA